jgi:hypothetical protein
VGVVVCVCVFVRARARARFLYSSMQQTSVYLAG